MSARATRIAALKQAAKERILILDGSWGVMFQKKGLKEADFRAERFKDYPGDLKGNNDILCLTRPDLVAELHDLYFGAGADISETNTFSATTIAQDDYKLEIKILKLTVNEEITADRFELAQPEGTELVHVGDEKAGMQP